ncbi:MAG: BatD family protein, partial [Luteimonas sp.]
MNARAARFAFVALAWLLAAAPVAHAQSLRAWLDRDRIALGETATLNIEIDGAATAEPDYSPLLGDFEVTGNTSSRSVVSDAAGTRMRTRYAVDLQPRREGVLDVPALAVGARRTQPLSLAVTAPSASPARAGDAAFIESEADAPSPSVQQAVGYVVRLYVGVPLVSSTLDQPDPEGASLRQVGDDVRYQRDLQGRHYTVIERHYLLLPERSGTLSIPGARFTGRGVGGFFDDVFGDGQRTLAATGAPRTLAV